MLGNSMWAKVLLFVYRTVIVLSLVIVALVCYMLKHQLANHHSRQQPHPHVPTTNAVGDKHNDGQHNGADQKRDYDDLTLPLQDQLQSSSNQHQQHMSSSSQTQTQALQAVDENHGGQRPQHGQQQQHVDIVHHELVEELLHDQDPLLGDNEAGHNGGSGSPNGVVVGGERTRKRVIREVTVKRIVHTPPSNQPHPDDLGHIDPRVALLQPRGSGTSVDFRTAIEQISNAYKQLDNKHL